MNDVEYISNQCVCGFITVTPMGDQMNSQLQHQMLRTLTVMESFYKENIPLNETIKLEKGFAEVNNNTFLPHKAFALVRRIKKIYGNRDQYYTDAEWIDALETLLEELYIEFEIE